MSDNTAQGPTKKQAIPTVPTAKQKNSVDNRKNYRKKRTVCTQLEFETEYGDKMFFTKGTPKIDSMDLFDKGFIRHPEPPDDFIRSVVMSLAGIGKSHIFKEEELRIKLPGEVYFRTYPWRIFGRQRGNWEGLMSALMNGGILEGTRRQRSRLNAALVAFFNDHCSIKIPKGFKTYDNPIVGIFKFKFQVEQADAYGKLKSNQLQRKTTASSPKALKRKLTNALKTSREDQAQELIVFGLKEKLVSEEELVEIYNKWHRRT